MATTHTARPDFRTPQWSTASPRASRRQSYPSSILRNHSTIRTEDDHRLLPPGWVRQTDPNTHKDFFVDTTVNPAFRTWRHPYDSRTHSPAMRRTIVPAKKNSIAGVPGTGNPGNERALVHFEEPLHWSELAEEDRHLAQQDGYFSRHSSGALEPYDHTSGSDFDDDGYDSTSSTSDHHRTSRKEGRIRRAGTFIKDAWTEGSQQRARRASDSSEAYRMRELLISASSEARTTGRPAFLMRDDDGCPVYVEPPNGPAMPKDVDTKSGSWGAKNPYVWPPYTEENAKFVRVLGAEKDKKGGGHLGVGLAGAGILGVLGGAAISSATT